LVYLYSPKHKIRKICFRTINFDDARFYLELIERFEKIQKISL